MDSYEELEYERIYKENRIYGCISADDIFDFLQQ